MDSGAAEASVDSDPHTAGVRAQQAPPYALQAPSPGCAPGLANGYYHQPSFIYSIPYYMAAGTGHQLDPRAAEAPGSPPSPLQQRQQQPAGAPVATMDALKARVMDAAPGEVKDIISSTQFVPRAAAFTSLIQLAAKAKQPQKAIEIFEAMASVNVQANTFSYSALISALARAGRWQEAERYFNELLAKAQANPDMTPNTVTYAALISAYEKGGQLGKALAAFEQQLAQRVPPDIITYSSLITACERAGHTAKAAELLDQMHSAGLAGNHQLYHGVLSACQAAGQWELALEVFLGMQCSMLRPTSHTVNLMLGTLVGAGQTEHALWLLREAARAQYDLAAASFNAVLQLLAAIGDWQRATAVFKSMSLQKVKPDGTTAGLLVAACVQGGNQGLAQQLAAEFQQQGLLVPPPPPPQPTNGNSVDGEQQAVLALPVPLPVPLPTPLAGAEPAIKFGSSSGSLKPAPSPAASPAASPTNHNN